MILCVFAKSEGCEDFTTKRFCKAFRFTKSMLATSCGGPFFTIVKLMFFFEGSVFLKEDEQRKIIINFRVTPSEKKNLQEKAEQAHMSLSSYLVALSENKKIVVAENIPELVYEISKIGTNINQIAHIGNSQRYVDKQQLACILKLMDSVKSDMQKILSEIHNENEHTFSGMERKIDLLLERTEYLNGNL